MFKWMRGFASGLMVAINLVMMFIIMVLWEVRKDARENTKRPVNYCSYRRSEKKEVEK